MTNTLGAVAAVVVVLTGCAGQRPTVDQTSTPTATPASSPYRQLVTAETCGTWLDQRFKGGDDPDQVQSARTNWAWLLVDGQATDGELTALVRDLGLYCPAHRGDDLRYAAATVLAGIRGSG